MSDSDLTPEQLDLLRDQIAPLLNPDWPIDAITPNVCAALNDPTNGPLVTPVLKPVDLPTLIVEGLITPQQLSDLAQNPLTVDFFRRLVAEHPYGATALTPAIAGLIQAARVALILDDQQSAALVSRFDPVVVRAADQSGGDPNLRTGLAPVSWAIANLGRLVNGDDIQLAMEEQQP